MHLAHDEAGLGAPTPVDVAERGVAKSVRVALEVLEVEQLERHSSPAQLLVDDDGIRPLTMVARHGALPVKTLVEGALIELFDVGPREPEVPCASGDPLRDPDAHANAPRDLADRQPAVESKPQYLSNLIHRQSLRRHRGLLRSLGCLRVDQPASRAPGARGAPVHEARSGRSRSRSRRSRCPIRAFTMPISVFTMRRFGRS